VLVRECADTLSPPGHALEVAPLTDAVFGGFLRGRGWSYVSVDRWRTGNPHDPRHVEFVDHELDVTDLNLFGDDEFQLIIVQHVIEEVEDFERALAELARVLADDGAALLEIPYDARRERSERQPPNHYGNVWMFGRDLREALERHFGGVESRRMAEGGYRGEVFVCRTGGGSAPGNQSTGASSSGNI
jgi:hypothetical protein